MAGSTTYRVAQWATGTVGAVALRAVIQHPDMELVGVHVYSAAKEGQDAGDLCGLPATGVRATRTIDAVLAAKPDCVVYMPESTMLDDVVRLLEAGINISTTRAEFFNPATMPAGWREAVEAACARGNASIHATGSSPGFITEALPIVLASLARRIDLISIDEYAFCLGGVVSEEMLTTYMGFGDTPEAFAKREIAQRDEVFEHSLAVIADAIGLPLDRFEASTEVALAKAPIRVGVGTVQPGQVAGQRNRVTGYRSDRPLMRFTANWYIATDLDPAWELPADSGWRVKVEGDTPLDIAINFPAAPEQRELAHRGLTAHRPVNAIPALCAAPPGIVTTVKLGQVIPRFG